MENKLKLLKLQLKAINTEILLNQNSLNKLLDEKSYITSIDYSKVNTSKTNSFFSVVESEALDIIRIKDNFNKHIRELEVRKEELKSEIAKLEAKDDKKA